MRRRNATKELDAIRQGREAAALRNARRLNAWGEDGRILADYMDALQHRFRAVFSAFTQQKIPYAPAEHAPELQGAAVTPPWAHKDTRVLPELERQYTDWRAYYNDNGPSAIGYVWGDYNVVKEFDLNLTRVVRKAEAAGADISGIPTGRHDDPYYKPQQKGQEEPKGDVATTVGNAIGLLKWGVLAYVGVSVVQALRK